MVSHVLLALVDGEKTSADFLDWQAQATTVDALALSAMSPPAILMTEAGELEMIAGLVVTERFFDIIGPTERAHAADQACALAISFQPAVESGVFRPRGFQLR